MFTGGLLIDHDGATKEGAVAPNIVACNINPDGDKKPASDFESGYLAPDGVTQITARYMAKGFTCFSGANALVASAVALVAAASMI